MKTLVYITLVLLLVVSCSSDELSENTGQGGSTARFTISQNHLYIVDTRQLKTFSLANPKAPVPVNSTAVGFDIETIFCKGNLLFLGTRTGMYIYSIENPAIPEMLSKYDHIYSCDPVVADNEYAYVTLNSEAGCNFGRNSLDVVDIRNPRQPVAVKSYNMLISPKGLAISGKKLFVCDKYQLVVFDVTNPADITQIAEYPVVANDIIVRGNLVLLIDETGFNQLKYENDSLKFLSKITIN